MKAETNLAPEQLISPLPDRLRRLVGTGVAEAAVISIHERRLKRDRASALKKSYFDVFVNHLEKIA